MSRIVYLVCGTTAQGHRDAEALCGAANKLNANDYAMPDKNLLRVVRRFVDLIPMAGKTSLVKGSDFDEMPEFVSRRKVNGEWLSGSDELSQTVWLENRESFEQFVAAGHGEWVDVT